MPPIERRRRRRRHFSRSAALAAAGVVVAVLVVAALIGGLLRAPSQSVGYERAVDRSYAAQARLFVAESNRLGAQLHALLRAMRREDRTTLEVALDTLARSSASVARQATTAASPAPSGGAGSDVAAAMAARATAMLALRSAVDRLLGMAPLPAAGAPDPSATAAPRPLSSAAAAVELAKVGVLLARSDRSYDRGRRVLRAEPGGALLPRSTWAGRPGAWTTRATAGMAEGLVSSPSLAVERRVELVSHALALTPAPVPPAGPHHATGGIAVLPPTGRLAISVVVADDGNVGERGIAVRATVTEVPAAPSTGAAGPEATTRRLSLTAHSSAAVTLPGLRIVPGRRYTVAVTVDPPVPNTSGAVTSESIAVRVAPPAAPMVGQLLPAKGRQSGGGDVTILGSGFTWVSAVTFGTTPARFKVISSTQITAIAPPGTGTVTVKVANPGGASPASTGDRYRYRHR